MLTEQKRLILASASPRRKQLLSQMGIFFDIIPADVDETVFGEPTACVMQLAERKAFAVAETYPTRWVLAADTLVFLNNEALGKPKDKADAERMLTLLSGNWHQVITGVCLMNKSSEKKFVLYDSTDVLFSKVTRSEITAYIATGEPMDKAGAYAIQGIAGMFIEQIRGSYSNVIGLPMASVRRLLQKAEWPIL